MTKTGWFHLDEVPRGVRFRETESRMVVAGAGGRGNRKLLFHGYAVSVLQMKWVLGTVAQQWEGT